LKTQKTGNHDDYRSKRSMCYTFRLSFYYVSCLRSARTFNNIEFNFLTFGQGFETIFLNGREMNENVAAVFSFDEAITFFCAKPFYFTVHDKSS